MRILMLFTFIILSNTSFAEVYKWQDSSGKVGYGNVPPAKDDVLYKEFKSSVKKADTPLPATKTGNNEPDSDAKKAEADEKEKKTALHNCARAKESLQMLQSGVRVVRHNDKGEREVLDDKMRKEEITNSQKAIEDWCADLKK